MLEELLSKSNQYLFASTSFSSKAGMENSQVNEHKNWGVFLLSSSSFFPRTGKAPSEFPEWVERHIRSCVGHFGAVIWDYRTEKVSSFSAGECLALLER